MQNQIIVTHIHRLPQACGGGLLLVTTCHAFLLLLNGSGLIAVLISLYGPDRQTNSNRLYGESAVYPTHTHTHTRIHTQFMTAHMK